MRFHPSNILTTLGLAICMSSQASAAVVNNLPVAIISDAPLSISPNSVLNIRVGESFDADPLDGISAYQLDLNNDNIFELLGTPGQSGPVFYGMPGNEYFRITYAMLFDNLGLGVGDHIIRLRVTDFYGAIASTSTTLTLRDAPDNQLPEPPTALLVALVARRAIRPRREIKPKARKQG